MCFLKWFFLWKVFYDIFYIYSTGSAAFFVNNNLFCVMTLAFHFVQTGSISEIPHSHCHPICHYHQVFQLITQYIDGFLLRFPTDHNFSYISQFYRCKSDSIIIKFTFLASFTRTFQNLNSYTFQNLNAYEIWLSGFCIWKSSRKLIVFKPSHRLTNCKGFFFPFFKYRDK